MTLWKWILIAICFVVQGYLLYLFTTILNCTNSGFTKKCIVCRMWRKE